MHSLGGIDLNLMVALHALLEETNVTAAARRAGVSQPAMSRSLARLRLHFGDPLLIRAGRRMVPTARAVALVDEVRQAVQSLERLWANNNIEPSQLRADIRLVTDDHVGTTLLPSAVAHLARVAPGVGLDVLARDAGSSIPHCRLTDWSDEWRSWFLTSTRHWPSWRRRTMF
ncbi:MAG: LysR family transcriptional regulator [Myxococcales bacterium]|nr:LysR family transcriptional regulator [Myxococcales bacterium]